VNTLGGGGAGEGGTGWGMWGGGGGHVEYGEQVSAYGSIPLTGVRCNKGGKGKDGERTGKNFIPATL